MYVYIYIVYSSTYVYITLIYVVIAFVYCQCGSWRKTKYVLTSRFMNRSVYRNHIIIFDERFTSNVV